MSDFSILNESSLHNTLKKIYALQSEGKSEVELNGFIYDIVTNDEQVIEIQNQNLYQLLPKIKDTIKRGIKIKVVHPVVLTKLIELYDENNMLIKKSRSPVKGCIHSIFKEIKGIYEVLLNPLFTLEVPLITITEIRIKEENNVQSKNKKRRYKIDWNKKNKKLNEILETKTFRNKEDYLNLLPPLLPEEFSSNDLKEGLKKIKAPYSVLKNPNLILWTLTKMNLLIHTRTEGKKYFYIIVK